MIVVMGEFGRTPKINSGQPGIPVPGRDHWGNAISVMVAGGGLKPGVVVGATNDKAERPKDRPLKPADLLATIYHQLNEARTDPDVDDATRTGDSARLGWYSAKGGEIGDIPVKEAGTSLALVFREVDLADGSGAVPVQLMWSNKAEAPAPRIA